jgi:hypothetical protein
MWPPNNRYTNVSQDTEKEYNTSKTQTMMCTNNQDEVGDAFLIGFPHRCI